MSRGWIISLIEAMRGTLILRAIQHHAAPLAILLAALAATSAQAQTTYTWNDSTSSWTTATAWTPNGPDWSSAQRLTDALASFGNQATIANQPVLNGASNVSVAGISIDDGGAAWNLSGSIPLNIGSGGVTLTGTGTKTSTISLSASTNLSFPQTWNIGQGMTLAVTGNFSGNNGLTKAGSGTLILSGTATYTGGTTVTGGLLGLSGDRSGANGTVYMSAGVLEVADRAKIGGNVVIPNDTGFQASQGGTAGSQTNSPDVFGDSPEEFEIEGDVDFKEGSELDMGIEGSQPESGYDRMDVDGNVSVGGATLNLVAGDFTPNLGDIYYIINNKSSNPIDGQFANAPEGSILTSGGHSFQITYFADVDSNSLTGGNDLALVAVPEPASICLALSAAALLAARFARHKSRC